MILLLASSCESVSPIETPTPDPHVRESPSPLASFVPLDQGCTNEVLSYTIKYPAGWATVDQGERACTLFGPGKLDGCETAAVAVTLTEEQPQVESRVIAKEELLVSGLAARRVEEIGIGSGELPKGITRLRYVIRVGPRYLTATTCGSPEEFEANKTILDSMVQSLEIIGVTQL